MYNKTLGKAVSLSGTQDEITALVKLFKIAPASVAIPNPTKFAVIDSDIFLEKGLLFVSESGTLLPFIASTIFDAANANYGNQKELFNQTFYKSFATVHDASPTKLLFDQIMHYMTTYGAEAMGVKVPTYVPVQALELPETDIYNKDFKFTVIQILSNDACIAKFDNYLTTLTAPSPSIMEQVKCLLPSTTVDTDDIKSFEVQVVKHAMDDTVPSAPLLQLRYLVYAITGETLIIKNRFLRNAIKNSDKANTTAAQAILIKCNAHRLASIFLRFKPIFLAFKGHTGCAPMINRLRRLAETEHAPLNNDSFQTYTSIRDAAVKHRLLETATNRDIIKLLNSVYTRMAVTTPTPNVIAVRNGRTFVKENGILPTSHVLDRDAEIILDTLIKRLQPVLQDKVFYYPSYIDYAIPTTEKQFIGNIPYGTAIAKATDSDAFTAGIHWTNQDDMRVDIDLHMSSALRHFGWNGSYRDEAEILYTGDQTDAPLPLGAAEAFWFTPVEGEPFILTANLYSGPSDTEYKFFMTEAKPTAIGERFCRGKNDYTYDPQMALFPAIPMKFINDERAMTLGMFIDGVFYFYGGVLSNGIVPTANYEQFIAGLSAQLRGKSTLSALLNRCGATILDTVEGLTPEEMANVISLAPEDITVETLFNIIDGTL